MVTVKSYTDKPKRKPYFKHNVVYCKKGDVVITYVIGSVEHDKYDCYADNPVDACVAMIEKLNKLKML